VKAFWEGNELGLKTKKGRRYFLREKPSGCKELVVRRMIWTE
jgi:hypothetical protein